MPRNRGINMAIIATVFIACGAQNAMAHTADHSARAAPDKADIPRRHAAVISAFDLAETAVEAGDKPALLKAVRQLDALGARPMNSGNDAAKNWALMARKMGPNDDMETVPFRGRVKGPAYRKQSIAAGESDVLEEIYYAAEPAELTLKSSPANTAADAALVWTITEVGGDAEPICAGPIVNTAKACRFTPLWTGQYRIEITNKSEHAITYLFVTN